MKEDEKTRVINGLPIEEIGERSHISLFSLLDKGDIIRSYESLTGEEIRGIQESMITKLRS